MRSNILLTLFILCYLLPSFIYTFQVTDDVSKKDSTYAAVKLASKPSDGKWSPPTMNISSYKASLRRLKLKSGAAIGNIRDEIREKRQIESFDNDDYPSATSKEDQEEPSFWDRVVRVALKLFNRFIEWLNSS